MRIQHKSLYSFQKVFCWVRFIRESQVERERECERKRESDGKFVRMPCEQTIIQNFQ